MDSAHCWLPQVHSAHSFYGFLERLLIPTGLHHILNQLIRFTPIGGSAMIDGQQVSGALNIFNTLLMQAEPDMDVMRQAYPFPDTGDSPVHGIRSSGSMLCNVQNRTAEE